MTKSGEGDMYLDYCVNLNITNPGFTISLFHFNNYFNQSIVGKFISDHIKLMRIVFINLVGNAGVKTWSCQTVRHML